MPWMRAILSVARCLPRQLTLVSPNACAATVACRVVALCREPSRWHGPPRQLTPASPAAHTAAAACHAVSRSRHAASPSACGNTAVELASLAASPLHLALTVLHASLLYCTNGRTPKRRRHDGEQVNPDALAQAARADAERSASGGRCAVGLHGVPVLLKDNIATRDRLNTTAGSLALLGSVVRRDAGVVTRLRRAVAVILGKGNPSEWSNYRPVDSGWSARGGQTLNPYVLSVTPCGSETLGSETDVSILCPSSLNSVVGIKPTVGLTSRSGVIPITPLQDTFGYIRDAVHVLDVIVGYDELDDEATGAASKYIPHGGFTQFLRIQGLKAKRIGVLDVFFQGYDDMQLAVIAFNEAHPVEERLKDFGQPDLIAAEKTNDIGTRERAAIQRLKEISTNGLEKLMKEHQLDAIVAPNSDASSVLAVGGYPGIAVPAGYDRQGVPFAICFGGLKGYEPRLIEIAYAFEQATKVRRPPSFRR
ncbi:unnamed protein product [Miscanthus lutarioriparius]|uniref:Amidase domain-containing protein n=1 Tax=Miscanthus lutarioriparius TaxID=422564 RepID=A0A811N4B8_9POAL|nr:unnamed protein product [Miscanthus lutarioriparius]